MRARREVHLLLFALAVIGVLGEAHARPSDQELDQLEDEYPAYGVSERQKQEVEGNPGSAGSEGTLSSWWSERRPCSCANSRCGCCTGRLFPLPPWLRPRMCTNLTYIEDEFALRMAVTFNDVVMYRRKVSGRNPPPVCISPPRISRAKLCIKLQDVYLIERNMHACMAVEGLYNNQVLFGRMLGCMRMGSNGFAVVDPEDGGGLPLVEPTDPDDEEPNDEDDYDQVDEDYDAVEEDNAVEGAAADGDDGGGNADAAKKAGSSKSKEGPGPTEGVAESANSPGIEKGSAKVTGSKETPNTHGVDGSKMSSVVPDNSSQEVAESTGSADTAEDKGTTNSTKQHQETSSTTEDEGLASTTEEEVMDTEMNGASDAGSPTTTEEEEGSEETTIAEESPKTTIELTTVGKKTGDREGNDDESTVPGESQIKGGEVSEESSKTEGKSTVTEETRDNTTRETKGSGGSSEEENADQGLVGEKEGVPKRSRDLWDGEIVGVGTVEEI